MSLAAAVKRRAEELGFVACGITDPSPVEDGGRLDRWLAGGYAGVMRYLHRQARKRKDPRLILPEAKSVVVVLDNYYDGEPAPGPPLHGCGNAHRDAAATSSGGQSAGFTGSIRTSSVMIRAPTP